MSYFSIGSLQEPEFSPQQGLFRLPSSGNFSLLSELVFYPCPQSFINSMHVVNARWYCPFRRGLAV